MIAIRRAPNKGKRTIGSTLLRAIRRGGLAAIRSGRRARLAWDRFVLWLELYDVGHGACRCRECRDKRRDDSDW